MTKPSTIKLLALDVDGVFTDARIGYASSGDEFRHFNVKDGYGIRCLLECNIEVALLSAAPFSVSVRKRAASLGITYTFLGCMDKLFVLRGLVVALGIERQEVAFLGDDYIDLPAMKWVGCPCAPADAHAVVKDHASRITTCRGGRGAIREICDMLIEGGCIPKR